MLMPVSSKWTRGATVSPALMVSVTGASVVALAATVYAVERVQ